MAPVLGYQTAANFIFDPLLGFLTSGNNTMQMQAASFCIKHLLDYFIE